MRLFIIFIVAAASSGCVSVQYNGADTKIRNVDHPKIGSVTTAYVGDELLAKGVINEEKFLSVKQTISSICYDIPAGSYKQIGFDRDKDFYSAVGVIKAPLCDPFTALSVERTPREQKAQICVITVFGVKSCRPGDYSREIKLSEKSESFQQTLIYSGRGASLGSVDTLI